MRRYDPDLLIKSKKNFVFRTHVYILREFFVILYKSQLTSHTARTLTNIHILNHSRLPQPALIDFFKVNVNVVR